MRVTSLLAIGLVLLLDAAPAAVQVEPAVAHEVRFDDVDPDTLLSPARGSDALPPLAALRELAPPLAEAIAPAGAPIVGPELAPDPVTGVVATAGLLALLGGLRWLALGVVALYSRLTRSELLDNAHREKVFRLVQEGPGMGVTAIMQAAGLGWGTTVYHLDRLERAGLLASERVGMHRCYFPVGTVRREDRRAVATLQAEPMRDLAQAVAASPGATQSELCVATGLSASALSKQVTKLENAGLVRRERDGKLVRLWPTAERSARTIQA